MANIFISYNRQSKEITTTLANDIEAIGHTVWFDQELSGGQVWWDQILARVRGCDVFVFVLDPKALNSTACKREYGYAADLGKPILPVLVSEGVSTNLLPPALSQIQFVDCRMQDRHAIMRLARAFTTVPPSKPLPDPLPLPPEAPISYLGGLTEQVETTSTLSYQQQCALVVDLRKSLRDPETTDDTQTLLERLRKRHDLFATIAQEIDELLGSPRQASSVGHAIEETKSETIAPPAPERPPEGKTSKKSPIIMVAAAIIIVLIVGGIFFYSSTNKAKMEQTQKEKELMEKKERIEEARRAEDAAREVAARKAYARGGDAEVWVKKGIEFYKANGKNKALAAFSDSKGQFVKYDLYIYVLDLNGKMLAHPKADLVGQDFMVRKDADGKLFAVDIVKTAKEKGSGWVDYSWENPKTRAIDPKTVYFEKVDDIIICSGAYKK